LADDSIAYSKANLLALQKAIVDGVRRVKYTDKEVEYRSLDDMLKIEKKLKAELGLDTQCGSGKGLFGGRRIVGRHSKGLDDC
jgi:hypothetical protein